MTTNELVDVHLFFNLNNDQKYYGIIEMEGNEFALKNLRNKCTLLKILLDVPLPKANKAINVARTFPIPKTEKQKNEAIAAIQAICK